MRAILCFVFCVLFLNTQHRTHSTLISAIHIRRQRLKFCRAGVDAFIDRAYVMCVTKRGNFWRDFIRKFGDALIRKTKLLPFE